MPLVALTDSDERIVSLDLDDKDRSIGFRCPYCNSELRLVISHHKVTHFRHLNKSQCIFSGESRIHLECKEFLYNRYISTDKYDVELESRQFIINGIPKRVGDVVLFPKEDSGIRLRPIVIEVQNSNITIHEIYDRFNDWNGGGFSMLWVLTHYGLYSKFPDWVKYLWWVYGGVTYFYKGGKVVEQSNVQTDPSYLWRGDECLRGYPTTMDIVQRKSPRKVVGLRRIERND